MTGSGRSEPIKVYAPRQVKAELLQLVDRQGGSVSAYVLGLIREDLRADKRFSARPQPRP